MFICNICRKELITKGTHLFTHTKDGFTPWNKGKKGVYTPEILAKLSSSQIARFKRMPTPNKGIPHTQETKRKMSQKSKGRKIILSEETRANWLRKESEAHKGRPAPEHVRKILAEYSRMRQANPILKEELCRRALQGLRKRPTALEKQVIILCEKHNLPFRYVGDGQIWIAAKNPDFININGEKEVVEILGSYWHNPEETQRRIEHYARYGFKCITIWENELKNENLVLSKLGGST